MPVKFLHFSTGEISSNAPNRIFMGGHLAVYVNFQNYWVMRSGKARNTHANKRNFTCFFFVRCVARPSNIRSRFFFGSFVDFFRHKIK